MKLYKKLKLRRQNNGNRSIYISIKYIYIINFHRLLCCLECNTIVAHTFNVSPNAISSVIIVGAIIAALAGSSENVFSTSSTFGFIAIILAAVNIFGGFLVTQRMLQMYKKKKGKK